MSRIRCLRIDFNCFKRVLSTKSNPSSTATQQADSPKMDLLKSNPYFAKYENKLKTIYK